MFCSNCGSNIIDEAKFCQICGKAVISPPPSQPPVSTQQQFPPNQVYEKPLDHTQGQSVSYIQWQPQPIPQDSQAKQPPNAAMPHAWVNILW